LQYIFISLSNGITPPAHCLFPLSSVDSNAAVKGQLEQLAKSK
jgi:hypothetical protein